MVLWSVRNHTLPVRGYFFGPGRLRLVVPRHPGGGVLCLADAFRSRFFSERGDFSAAGLRGYRQRCMREYGRSLRWSSWFMRLVHRYPELLLKTLVADKGALERYLDIPVRNVSYEAFLTWLLPRLAGKLIRLIVKSTQD